MSKETDNWKDFLYDIDESDKKSIENIFDELAFYIKKTHLEDTDHSMYLFVIAKEVYKLIGDFNVKRFVELYHKAYIIDTINTFKAQYGETLYDIEACVCKSVAFAIAELIKDPDAGELGDIITKAVNNNIQNHESIDTFKRLSNLREFLDEGYDEIAKIIIPYLKNTFRLTNDDCFIELNDDAPFVSIQFQSNPDDCLIIEKKGDNKNTFDFKLYLEGNNIKFLSKCTSVLELINLLLNLKTYDMSYYYQTESGLKELIADRLEDIQSTYSHLRRHDLNVLNKVLIQALNISCGINDCTTQESPIESVSDTKNQESCDNCENCNGCIEGQNWIEDCEYECIDPKAIKDEIMMSHELNAKHQKYSKEDTLTVLEFLEDTYGNNPNYRNFLRDIRKENGLDVDCKTL